MTRARTQRTMTKRPPRNKGVPGVRIIAGRWRSRRLSAPGPATTRPMTDRVKEAVFSVLGSYYGLPGSLPAMAVADVFAGSGSLGLEAVSRGAARCRFFESDAEALKVLRGNLVTLNAGPELSVVVVDAWHASLEPPVIGSAYDLIFLDPPYGDSRDVSPSGLMHGLFERCIRERLWAADAVAVVHHEAGVTYPESFASGSRVIERRRYGSTAVTLFGLGVSAAPTRRKTHHRDDKDSGR